MRIVISCLLCIAALAPAAFGDETVESLKAEVEALKAQNAELRAMVEALKQQNAVLAEQMNATATDNQALKAKAVAMERQVVALSREKQTLTQEIKQEQQRSARLYTARSYNPSNDTTTVATPMSALNVGNRVIGDHFIAADFDHPGKTVTAPVDSAVIRVQTSFSAGDYRTVNSALLMIDGQPENVRISNYEKQSRTVGGVRNRRRVADESFDIEVTRALVTRIANAKRVTIKFGRASAALSPGQIETFSALAEAMAGG